MKQRSIQWLNQTIDEITQSDKGVVKFYKDGNFYKAYDLEGAVEEEVHSEMIFTYNSSISPVQHCSRYPIIIVNYGDEWKHILVTDNQISSTADFIIKITENYSSLSDAELTASGRNYYQLPIYNILKVNGDFIAMKVYLSKYASSKHIKSGAVMDGLRHNFVTFDLRRRWSLPDLKTMVGLEYNEEVCMFKPTDCKPTPLKDLQLVVRPKEPSPYVFSL